MESWPKPVEAFRLSSENQSHRAQYENESGLTNLPSNTYVRPH